MKGLVKAAALAAAFTLPAMASAQDEVEATVSADLVSSYIWRGQDLGSAALQPTVGVSYKGLSLTAWGSYGLVDRNDTKELDLTLSYSLGNFTVGVTDYYCTGGAENCPGKYFQYEAHKTGHTFELNLGYDFGGCSVNWYTNFAGADGYTHKGKRAYTSYVEVAAPFEFGGLSWEATVGAVPYNVDGGFYTDSNSEGFAVTNIGLKASKDVKIAPSISLPVFGAIAANPSTQKIFFTAGVTF